MVAHDNSSLSKRRAASPRPVFFSILFYHTNFSLYIVALPAAMYKVSPSSLDLPITVGSFAGGLGVARLIFRRKFVELGASSLHRIANWVQLAAALLILAMPLSLAIAAPRFLHGVSCAFFSVALGLWISEKVPAEERGRFRGVEGALIAIIMLVVPFGGLLLSQRFGFSALPVLALIGATAACFFTIGQTSVAASERFSEAARDTRFTALLCVLLAGGALIGSIETYFPALVSWKGFITVGQVVLVFGTALIVGRGVGGVAADRCGRVFTIRICGLAGLLGAVGFHFAIDPTFALTSIAMLALGVGGFITAANTAIADIASATACGGRLISDATLSLEFGQFLAPLMLGIAAASAGIAELSFATCAIAAAVSCLAFLPLFSGLESMSDSRPRHLAGG